MARLFAVLGLVALLAGCADLEVGSQGTASRAAHEPLEPLLASLADERDGAAVQALTDRLGTPDRIDAEPYANRYDPDRTDTVRTLAYDGVEVAFYEVAGLDKTFPIRVTVTGQGFEIGEGVRVGSSRTEVEALLGDPAEREGEAIWVYWPDPRVPDRVELHFAEGSVSRIDWLPYWE